MFEDNAHTIEGRSRHRIVDMRGKEAKPSKKQDSIHRRSVSFSSRKLGITGKLDLLEEKADENPYPVEYKKGKKPKDRDPWPNDQIQLCAQAMLMGENGIPTPEKGYLYYIASKARVEVPITEELVNQTKRVIAECREISEKKEPPPLANNRNKCFGCSLNAICLPEEEGVLKREKTNAKKILPSGLEGDILYVDTIGAYLGISGQSIKITAPGGNLLGQTPLENLREIVLCGPVQSTSQMLHKCLLNNIPVHYMTLHGRYLGLCTPMLHFHGLLREAQWKAHFDSAMCLRLAKAVVEAKVGNMKTIMMRYLREDRNDIDRENFKRIKSLNKHAQDTVEMDSLRGYEGMVGKIYFSNFKRYIKPDKRAFFYFNKRNRRPPEDPVNALLSFGYSLLAKDCTGAGIRVGLDPYCGFYHTMKYGRPSLALDIMEAFRQPIVDSMVLSSINNGVFNEKDFYQYQTTCYLNEKGRKKFLARYEMRKKDLVTHPTFHYRMSYERTIELQLRLLGKYLLNDVDSYEVFSIR